MNAIFYKNNEIIFNSHIACLVEEKFLWGGEHLFFCGKENYYKILKLNNSYIGLMKFCKILNWS